MIDKFNKYISNNKLLKPDDEVLVAVSGGIDSTVMLDLFSKSGIKFAIAHCNFKLRGSESDGDEKFVRQLAHDYNVDIFVGICNAADYAKTEGLSTQESARKLRYAWFEKICRVNNFTIIAIGHNKDDKIETFFINMFRGAGLSGLRSIPVKRDNIIRPLMFATRKQIVDFAKNNNINSREDSSNSTDHYLRNRIRHNLIPQIEEISPGFAIKAQHSIDNLNDADLLLKSVIANTKKQLFHRSSNNTIEFSIAELKKLYPTAIWLYYLLAGYGFSRQVTDAVFLTLTDEKINVGKRYYSAEYELLIDRNNIIIRPIADNTYIKPITISVTQTTVNDPLNLIMKRLEKTVGFKFNSSSKVAYFDFDRLSFPLTVRRWHQGDRIIPFGMSGSKLVSDILINNKISLFEKENTYVLLSDKKIIWVIGQRSSNEFRVKKSTKYIYEMKIL